MLSIVARVFLRANRHPDVIEWMESVEMKTYPAEISAFSRYSREHDSIQGVRLSVIQNEKIKLFITTLLRKDSQQHTSAFLLQLVPVLFLFLLFVLLLTWFPPLLLKAGLHPLLVALAVGLFHGVFAYQWVIYTMHEWAAHQTIRRVTKSKFLHFLAQNACRLFFADPFFYAENHASHHSQLGTLKDQTFVQFVDPRRLAKTLLPGAGVLFKVDFQVYGEETWTRSRLVSYFVGAVTLSIELILLSRYLDWWIALIGLVFISTWVGLSLDRIRDSFEHNLMPAELNAGTRELGCGITELLVGGGPWGQIFHFSHHLGPSLTWIQQWRLHFYLKHQLLTTEQLSFFGFSRRQGFWRFFATLLWRNWTYLRKEAPCISVRV